MMLFKYVDANKIIKADKYKILFYGNKQVINPTEDDFIQAGYKPLEVDDKPIIDEETELISTYFEDKLSHIEQHWKIEKIEEDFL